MRTTIAALASTVLIATGVIATGVSFTRRLRRRSLSGAVVVITGGSRGLGLCLARALARRGAQLAICARDRAELDEAARSLAPAAVLPVVADVCRPGDMQRLMAETLARYGRVDVLIANAGIIQVGPHEAMTL